MVFYAQGGRAAREPRWINVRGKRGRWEAKHAGGVLFCFCGCLALETAFAACSGDRYTAAAAGSRRAAVAKSSCFVFSFSPPPTPSASCVRSSVCVLRPRRRVDQWSERMARSWWASKRVSELELQTPLTVSPCVTIQVCCEALVLCLAPVMQVVWKGLFHGGGGSCLC